MPIFKIETNLPQSKIPEDFLKSTSAFIAKILGKPESYVIVHVVPDQEMSFGGSTDPCANTFLMSIGKLGVAENKKHSKAIADHLQKTLSIPKNRFYITFSDQPTANVGYDGTTFHEIFG